MTEAGDIALISPCEDAFCITFTIGEHSGKQVGHLSVDGLAYSGNLIIPVNDQEVAVDAVFNENTLQIKGCVMMVVCKTQVWVKQ